MLSVINQAFPTGFWHGGGAKLLFVLSVASADATKLSHPRLFLIFFLHTSACRTEEG
jgi:hypothetical protein